MLTQTLIVIALVSIVSSLTYGEHKDYETILKIGTTVSEYPYKRTIDLGYDCEVVVDLKAAVCPKPNELLSVRLTLAGPADAPARMELIIPSKIHKLRVTRTPAAAALGPSCWGKLVVEYDCYFIH